MGKFTTTGPEIGGRDSARASIEQQQAGVALRESEEHYRDLVEHSHDLICTHDLQGRLLSVNEAAVKLLGYDRETLLHKNLREILAPEFQSEFHNHIAALQLNGVSQGLMCVQTKTGAKRIWEFTNTLRTEGILTPIVRGMAHDVTERRRAEAALAASEAELRALFAAMTDVIIVLDAEGRYLKIAPTDPAYLYKPPAALIGKRLHEVFPPEQVEFFMTHIHRALELGRMHRVEYSLPIDGAEVWFDGSVSPVSGNSVIWVARDVSERKRAEEERRVIFEISEGVSATPNLDELLKHTHRSISQLLYAENCFVALHDPATDSLQFEFWVDKFDPAPGPRPAGTGFAGYVLRTGQPLLLTDDFKQRMYEAGKVNQVGSASASWLGVPLRTPARTIGVLVVQHYEAQDAYTRRDLEFLASVGDQVALAIERKRAEEALRESEARYRLLFEANPNPMWVYDLETLRFLAVNEAAVCRYGYARAEFMALTIKDIRPREDVQALLKNVSGVGGGIDEAGVWLHRKKDGQLIDVEIISHELSFAGRRAELVLANDVTERRRIGEMQARRADQLALRADVSAALAETDVPLRRTLERCTEALVGHLGAALARIWTFNKEENILELQASAGLYTHIDGPQARVPLGAFKVGLIAEERQPHITNEVVTDPRVSDKEWVARAGMVAFAGYPLLVEDRLVGVMAMFARHTLPDDTIDALASVADLISQGIERKRAEEEVQEANRRAIIEYERLIERLAALAQSLGTARDLMTIYQAIRGFAFASTSCTGIFISLYEAEINTRRAVYAWRDGAEVDLSSLPPLPMNNTPHSRAISTGQIIITADFQAALAGLPVDNVGRDQDPALPQSSLVAPMAVMGRIVGAIEVQSTRPAAFNKEHATALRMAANLAANAIENVQLFERERQHEEQLRQAQKMEAIGQLAGGVAHDFNNLLTAITGYSDLSLRKLKANDPVRHNIEEVKKAGERAAGLTRQLLAFSRKQVLQPKVINLNNVINNTAKMLRRLIGEDIELVAINKQELGYVLADPGQIEQVLMNLAVNARDAMPQGGRIVIEAENVVMDEQVAHQYASVQSGPHVRLTVTDTGCGMDEKTRQRIFEPFFTTKEVGHGTGLGLSTVYGIIKQSSGYISVASEPGVGTTFQIYLPRVAAPVEEQGAVAKAAAPGGTESILLVEDEQMVRQFTRNVLEMLGYTVLEAANGDEAVSLSQEHKSKIDLLLTDVVMPGMSARQLAEQIKALRPELAVLYMSGYTDDTIVHHGVLEQGTEFLAKPFTPDGLACKVRAVLDTRSGH